MKGNIYVIMCSLVGLLSAGPIKFGDDNDNDNDVLHTMFSDIRSMISSFNVGMHRLNETKSEPNIETSDSFVLPHDKIRKLIEKKMMGADNDTIDRTNKTPKEDFEKSKFLEKREEIGCTEKEDCNKTSYCNKLSYTCDTCHKDGGKCYNEEECCSGFSCDDETNTCRKKKGIAGQSCSSKSDCGEDFCCAINDNGDGICQPYLLEGEECGNDPFASFFASQSMFVRDMTGLPNKCPCRHNLKCVKRRALLFMESQVCSKKEEKKSDHHKALIKITFKSSPLLKFHTDSDSMDDFPLQSLFPKETMRSLKVPKRSHTSGFTMRFSTSKDKKPSKVSFRKSPFSFFHITNPFDDQEIDEIKDDMKHKRNMKREKRKLINEVGEEARESVHHAVDGIFNTIMKKISFGEKLKFRE